MLVTQEQLNTFEIYEKEFAQFEGQEIVSKFDLVFYFGFKYFFKCFAHAFDSNGGTALPT